MSKHRSISIRKVIQTAVTLVLLTLCVSAMLSASKVQQAHTLQGIHIRIKNDDVCQFLSKEAVEDILLTQRHIDLKQARIRSVDVRKMEHILSANPWIDTVQVFVDNNRLLQVDLLQRVPELRVFERDGSSYYLDRALHVLPLSDRYTHYDLVFVQVPHLHDDSLNQVLREKMLHIAGLIKKNDFWNAQTAAIAVNSISDFELTPIMGKQKIRLGDTTDLQKKLENLLTFYKHIQQRIGWDKYEILDVRFRNQVVASPSLPWKMPVDRALTNMNWVKSIIGDEKIPVKVTDYPLTGDAVPATVVKQAATAAKPALAKAPVTEKKPVISSAAPAKTQITAQEKKPGAGNLQQQMKPLPGKPIVKPVPGSQNQQEKPAGKPKMVMPDKQNNR